ncbi:MAG TPA: endolytic transglycosylase MltG [Clostridiales bacterium]|nr:endolytic transglycosylase MltG [Clostridiales bacterium]
MKKQKQNSKKKIVFFVCLAVLVTLFTVVTVSFYGDLKKGALVKESATLTVEVGNGTLAVAALLKEYGVIGHEKLFACYAQGKGYDRLWQQGTFTVEKGMGYHALCALLTTPQLASIRVTIPEGKQVRQIAEIFAKAGVCDAADFLTAAAENTFDYPFLAGIDHENPLEGYLFPDTYYFEANTDPVQVINEMLANFERKAYLQPYIDRAEELGYRFDDMIILASMVESEATTRADRENVAGVFFNRLHNPSYTKLQSCVTVEYALGIKKSIISYADTRYDSPYNTYLYPGLPIGPICCPGIDSLEATLYYAENNYYYFQSDENGKLYFAETYGEHAVVQAKVQEDWEGEVIEDYNH